MTMRRKCTMATEPSWIDQAVADLGTEGPILLETRLAARWPGELEALERRERRAASRTCGRDLEGAVHRDPVGVGGDRTVGVRLLADWDEQLRMVERGRLGPDSLVGERLEEGDERVLVGVGEAEVADVRVQLGVR